MNKWMIRAKFKRSLIREGHSKMWTYKDGQYLYYGKSDFHCKKDGTFFKTESSAKSQLTKAKNMLAEGWQWAIENPEIIKVKISIID